MLSLSLLILLGTAQYTGFISIGYFWVFLISISSFIFNFFLLFILIKINTKLKNEPFVYGLRKLNEHSVKARERMKSGEISRKELLELNRKILTDLVQETRTLIKEKK